MTKFFKTDGLFIASTETESMYIYNRSITVGSLLGNDYWIEQGAIEITKEEFLSELESAKKNIESFTQQITN